MYCWIRAEVIADSEPQFAVCFVVLCFSSFPFPDTEEQFWEVIIYSHASPNNWLVTHQCLNHSRQPVVNEELALVFVE